MILYSRKCSGQFQVEETVITENDDRTNNSGHMQGGEEVASASAEKVEEIMSPSSYVHLFVVEL
jgi:hypothetical protein